MTANVTKNSTAQTNVTSMVNMTSNKSINSLAALNVTKNMTKNVTANATKNSTANASANATVGLISEATQGSFNLTSMMEKVTDMNKHGNYSVPGNLAQMNKTANVSSNTTTTNSSVQANATSVDFNKFTGIGSTKGQIELQQQKAEEQADEEIDNAVYSGEKTKVVADIEKITNKIKTHGNSLMQKQSKI